MPLYEEITELSPRYVAGGAAQNAARGAQASAQIPLFTSYISLLTVTILSMCYLRNQSSISGALGGILTPTSLSMLAVSREG